MSSEPIAPVGVILVGHQGCATALYRAAEQIAGPSVQGSLLGSALVLDTSVGCDARFAKELRDAFAQVDQGAGILVLVDLVGSSPASFCECMLERHRACLVSGMSLAMLLKLAHQPRNGGDAAALAALCADVGRRAIICREPTGDGS